MLNIRGKRTWAAPLHAHRHAPLAMVLTILMTLGAMLAIDPQPAIAGDTPGSICTPTTGTIGGGGISSDENAYDEDDDVATWVGRNMWIGAPQKGDDQTYGNVNGNERWPQQSYAVEAEGLTLVNGKLVGAMAKGGYRLVKDDGSNKIEIANGQYDTWHRNGFRFGVVGFGGQLRPASQSTALVVADNGAESNPLRLKDDAGNDVAALAFGETGRGWLGGGPYAGTDYGPATAAQKYYADIKSTTDNTPGKQIGSAQYRPGNGVTDSIYGLNGNDNQLVNWLTQTTKESSNRSDLLTSVYHTDKQGATSWRNFSQFQTDVLEHNSSTLNSLNSAHTRVDVYDSPSASGYNAERYNNANYIREKYNINKRKPVYKNGQIDYYVDDNAEHQYRLNVRFDAAHYEKIIKFTGDGKSPLQVFNLDAAQLTNGSAQGISFDFENIPENAHVVVNVTGKQHIEFNNGWRLWWNGEDVSNYYVEPGADWDWDSWNQNNDDYWRNQKREYTRRNALYSKVSSAIMWNFADAEYVNILGGKIADGQATWTAPQWEDQGSSYGIKGGDQASTTRQNVSVKDDPAAAMLGSIMIPHGSFEDHVSTNGRVWVGQDFMMHNPDALTEYAIPAQGQSGTWNYTDYSASLVNMDQERHNFRWMASYTTECAAIGWNKVDETDATVANTTWRIYSTLDQAQAADWNTGNNYLLEVADNGTNDTTMDAGVINVQSLTPNAAYYVREVGAPGGYAVNPNIYRIVSGGQGTTVTNINAVWHPSSTGWNQVSSLAATESMLHGPGSIINRKLPNVEWEKVDAEDTSTRLAGSAWTLTKSGSAHTIADTTTTRLYFNPTTANWERENPDYRIRYKLNNANEWVTQTVQMERCSTDANDPCHKEWHADIPTHGNGFQFQILAGDANAPETYQAFVDGDAQPFTVSDGTGYFSVVHSSQTKGTAPDCAYQSTLWRDGNPTAGKFRVPAVEDGGYTLVETQAPTGYVPSATSYSFTVANGVVIWGEGIDSDTSAAGMQIGNTRKPGEVVWEKIKSGTNDDPQRLAGSEWELEYTPYRADPGTAAIQLTIKDCMPSGKTEKINCTAIDNDYSWAVDVDTDGGKFTISGMPWGDYALTETKAPDGYNLDATPHEFSIGVQTVNGNAMVGTTGAGGTVTDNQSRQIISINLGKIGNEPGVMLPATGGEGRPLWPVALGVLCVVASIGCAFTLRVRK